MATLRDAFAVEGVMWKGKRLGDMDRAELMGVIYYLLSVAAEQGGVRAMRKEGEAK